MKTNKLKRTFTTLGVLAVAAVVTYFSINAFTFKEETTRTQPKYSNVRIFAQTPADFQKIQAAGLDVDHAITKAGQYSDTWLSEYEISLLNQSGIPYQILV